MNIEYLESIVDKLEELRVSYIDLYGMANCNLSSTFLDKNCGQPGCHAAWLALADPALLSEEYDFRVVANNFIEKAQLSCEDLIKYWNYPQDFVTPIIPPSSPFYGREMLGSMFSHKDFFRVDSWIFDVSIIISRWREFLERVASNDI